MPINHPEGASRGWRTWDRVCSG